MFVKIENYKDNKDNTIILNIDRISSIRRMVLPDGGISNIVDAEEKAKIEGYINCYGNKYIVIMDTRNEYILNKEQYEQICKILTTRL